jgi:hypothetical protein
MQIGRAANPTKKPNRRFGKRSEISDPEASTWLGLFRFGSDPDPGIIIDRKPFYNGVLPFCLALNCQAES